MRTRLLVAALSLALLAPGCGEEGGEGGHGGSGRSWTLLVYMVADNNLEPFALADLAEMAQVGSSDDVHIVAQIDRAAGFSADSVGNLSDFTSVKRILVEQGGFRELADLGELNMGAPSALQDFIEWGVKAYPADRTALVFWDHGGAWPGFGGDDSHSGDLLSLPELKQGMQAGMTAAGLKQFALIGFDACLMSTVEVALLMRPFGEYLLASEELEPGHGWDYQSLAVLANDPTTNPEALGRKLIEGFAAQAQQQNTGSNITLALTDLYALDDVSAGLGALAGFSAKVAEFDTVLGRQRQASLAFGESPDPRQSTHMVDLGDFIGRLAQADPRFEAVRGQIQGGLQKAVVAKTAGPVTSAATGLSIYFPTNSAAYSAGYDNLAETGSWRDFLRAFIGGAASEARPTFTNPNGLATAQLTSAGLALQGDLAPGAAEAISTATYLYGLRVAASNTILVLGEQPASWTSSSVDGTWDLSILALTQGATEGYAYLQVEVTQANELSAAIAFAYRASANAEPQYCVRRMVFDASQQLVQDTYYLFVNGQVGELIPAAGSQLIPLVQQIDAAGNVTWEYGSSAAFDPQQAINLGFKAFQVGSDVTVFGALAISNYAGEGDSVYTVQQL